MQKLFLKLWVVEGEVVVGKIGADSQSPGEGDQ
jgi:hypothetical protein